MSSAMAPRRRALVVAGMACDLTQLFAPARSYSMIRVAFDIHAIGQRATGNETYAEGLLRAFEANPPGDIEFQFYYCGAQAPTMTIGRSSRIRPAWPYLRIPIATPAALAWQRIDVAHFQYFAPPWRPCSAVLTIHDLSFERHPEYFSRGMAWRLRRLMPLMARGASHIITVSDATRQDLIELYRVPPERISVIHNGLPAGFRVWPPAQAAAHARARCGCERPIVLCVGNLGARKNQQRLVRVFARLVREHGCDHDLLLVGKDTSTAGPVIAEIARQGLGDRIRRVGYIGQHDLAALYNFATLTVYPSFYEGFGLPILESMACGTPVITSTVSCMPEIAGPAACLVDPGSDEELFDKLMNLLGDAEMRAELRDAGLTRCRQFSWAEAARRTLEVYRRVADG